MKNYIFLLLILTSGIALGQRIKIKVVGQEDDTVHLVKYIGKNLYYADTAILKNGIVEFKPSADLKPGVVALLLPGQKFFDFIYNKETEINLETSLADFVKDMKVKKSDENKVFLEYIKFIQCQKKIADGFKSQNAKLDSIGKTVTAYQNNLIKTYPTLLASKIVKMSMDVIVPDSPKDANGKELTENFRYLYYRQHYWDNIDLNDDRLVNAPIFHNKLEFYFGKSMLVQHHDTIIKYAFSFCKQLDPKSDMFKYCVDYITNTFAKSNIMGMDKVFVYMAEEFYCKKGPDGKSFAYWMSEEKLKELCKDIPFKKNTCLGNKVPNVILPDTTKTFQNLYKQPGDYKILVFWEPDCGHCKKTMPKINELWEKKLKARNVDVFAVAKAHGDDYNKWLKFIAENKFNFTNVALTEWLLKSAQEDPRKWVPTPTTLESLNYHETFDIFSTPQIFVLDKNNVIIAKKLTMSQLEDFFDRTQKIENPVKLFEPDPEDEAH